MHLHCICTLCKCIIFKCTLYSFTFLESLFILLYCILYIVPLKEGGHDNRVNDLCWSEDDSTLYSCSNDKHITEWNTESGQRKW